MFPAPATTLLASLQRLTDPRRRRGVRHPFAAVLALTFLGLLCRQTDFATLRAGPRPTGPRCGRPWASHAATPPTPPP